ncbi:MAG: sigma 54-interacting transcriptional regulator [Lentisphaeria bacterium]|nr:sigma 54-interacting transcriptional regulator [Lentisphaeria bacterium]
MPESPDVFTYQQLSLLNGIAGHLAAASELRDALTVVLDMLCESAGMARGVITLLNSTGDEISAAITAGDISQAHLEKMRYKSGEGVTGQVFASGVPAYLPSVDGEERFLDRSGLRRDLDGTRLAFFCVPICYRNTTIGTLSTDMATDRVGNPESQTAFLLEVARLVAPFVKRCFLEERFEVFHRARQPGGAFGKLIGNSAPMREIQRLIVRVADARTTVVITGDTGVGKGVVAELIHQLGLGRKHPFVEVNCGAIPESLIESELFGHEKGAFTGATQRRVGVLERAKAGTVFLDEIGELPLAAQTKLLRVLQNREFERVGGSETLRTGARMIAATNRNLEDAIIEGTFRSDLYYRLNVFPIRVPALRERGKADIMLLVDHFIERFSEEMGKAVTRIDTPAIDMLTAYHWPGNVRELENVIERAVLLADGDVIHGHHLPPSLQMNRYAPRREEHGDFTMRVRNFEVELITEALKDTNGNQTSAARKLGISKRIMQYKVQKYGIEYRRFRVGRH